MNNNNGDADSGFFDNSYGSDDDGFNEEEVNAQAGGIINEGQEPIMEAPEDAASTSSTDKSSEDASVDSSMCPKEQEAASFPVLLSDIKKTTKNYNIYCIGPQGGRCENPWLGFVLDVPENALEEETYIYVGESKQPKSIFNIKPERKMLSRQIVCGPHGVTFKKPVYLTFDCSTLNLFPPELPELYTIHSTEHAAWEKLDKALFSTTKVSAEIDHFSDYQVVAGPSGVTERRTMVVLVLACKEGSTINGLIVITDIGHRQDALALLPHGQVIAEEHEHITRGGALEVHVNEHHWQPMSDRLFDRPVGECHTQTFVFNAHAEATSYKFNVKIQNGTATPKQITNQMEFRDKGVGMDEGIRDDISTDVSLAPSVEAAVQRYIDKVKQPRDFPIPCALQDQIERELGNTEAGRKVKDHLVAVCGVQPLALSSSQSIMMCLHVWQTLFKSNTVEDLSELAQTKGCQQFEDIIESFRMSQST